ncbi:hypothetical protein ANRL3_00978 [Anaerolineae bacterium]|nr:hypothetical protein ANRL3_00978 [Anaerolineae bacterium]
MSKLLVRFILVAGLVGMALTIVGAVNYEPCQPTISSEHDDWWVLPNTVGTYDLIVYSHHAVVFDLTEHDAIALQNARMVGLARQNDGRFRLCNFR